VREIPPAFFFLLTSDSVTALWLPCDWHSTEQDDVTFNMNRTARVGLEMNPECIPALDHENVGVARKTCTASRRPVIAFPKENELRAATATK